MNGRLPDGVAVRWLTHEAFGDRARWTECWARREGRSVFLDFDDGGRVEVRSPDFSLAGLERPLTPVEEEDWECWKHLVISGIMFC